MALNTTSLVAYTAVVKNFLSNTRDENYEDLKKYWIFLYQELSYNMSVKFDFLHGLMHDLAGDLCSMREE